MKKIIIIFLSLFLSNMCFSQVHIAYKASSIHKLGVGYNFSEHSWIEINFYEVSKIEDFTPELSLCFNLVKKERHDFYLGVGGVLNYYTGFTLPIGTQIYPLDNFKKLSLNIEFNPIFDLSSEDIVLQTSCGVRYRFGTKNK